MGATKLHVGVVGVGRIGLFHARTLLEFDGVRVTVADADPARAAAVAADLGVEHAPSPEALVDDSRPDALLIAAPTASHVPLLRLALGAELPAFCEKPVALELAALEAVAEEAERAVALVQVGFQRRFDAGYRAARQAVADGTVGTVLSLRATTHDPEPPAEDYIAGSGGIFRDLHIHDFDAIRFVADEEIVEVYAVGAVRDTPWFADHDDVDTAAAVLRLESGTLAAVSGSRRDPRGYDVRLEVLGTADSIAVGVDERLPLRSVEPGVEAPRAAGYRNFVERFERAYRDELAHFVATVRAGGESACSLDEAKAALVVALAADRSRAERRPVTIEEVTSAAPSMG